MTWSGDSILLDRTMFRLLAAALLRDTANRPHPRSSDVEHSATEWRAADADGPFLDPLAARDGDPEQPLRSHPTKYLEEYCLYWEWRRLHHCDPDGRWWLSKYVSLGMPELIRRNAGPYGWLAQLPAPPIERLD